MLILKSFFRKKNTLSYLIINSLVFILIFILLICNEYFLCQFDLEYKDAKIIVISNEKISLNSKIYYLDDIKEINDMFYHEIKLYHWYNYQNKIKILTDDLKDRNVDIIPDFNTSNNKKIEQIMTIFNYTMKTILIGYGIFIVIVLINIISDNKPGFLLLKYLGFKDFKINGYFLLEMIGLFLMPFIFIFLLYQFISMIMF